jgi:hypothetical protein
VVVVVSGNYRVHLDILPLVLCVQIGGGCLWVMAGCGLCNQIQCLYSSPQTLSSNIFIVHETLAMVLLYLHLIWLLVAKLGLSLCINFLL